MKLCLFCDWWLRMCGLEKNWTRLRHRHAQTALVLYGLLIYLIPAFAFALYQDTSYDAMRAWVAFPLNAGFIMALLVVGFHHFAYGLQTIAEDYISNDVVRAFCVFALNGACLASAVAGCIATLVLVIGS